MKVSINLLTGRINFSPVSFYRSMVMTYGEFLRNRKNLFGRCKYTAINFSIL